MATISSPGLGSGLDVNSIVTQLMKVEQQPLVDLTQKEAGIQAKITAFGSLKGALSSFQTAVAALAVPAKFSATKASAADATVLTASSSADAAAGTYSIEVKTLAQAHKLKSAAFADTTSAVGTGTLTIQFGTYNSSDNTFTLNPEQATKTVTIDSAHSGLGGIRDAINAAKAGVTATIVNDGTGNRLVVSSNSSGTSNSLKITVSGDGDGNNTDNAGLSKLAYDPTLAAGSGKNLSETVAAVDASLVIDGIPVTKSSNTVSDAIQGVTLNLLKTNEGAPTTLTVARDTASIQTAVQSFVKAYNDLNSTLVNLSKYDAANKQASVLTGDATLASVRNQIKGVFNQFLRSSGGGFSSLVDIGVSFKADGTLALDSTKLTAALNDPTKDVSTLFAPVGKPTDSLVKFVSSSKDTQDGSYAVAVTQLATQGKAVGSKAADLDITAGVNDILQVKVDGTAVTVTLNAGSYTADSLAAEIQSKLNGASELSSAGLSVKVSQSGGVLTATSASYGSSSKVEVTGGTAADSVFGTATSSNGLDVEGTIDGVAASGSGQMLTAISGSASGLKLQISGDSTGGRGTVNYAHGYADRLDQLLDNLLDTKGAVNSKVDGLNATVKDIDKQRDTLQSRLNDIEARYRAQFTALDTLMSSMTKTSTFLTQQLANLPKIGSSN